jgi:RNA methyltransferase, TrmH family
MLTKAQVKYIQSLGHKKLREAEQVFVAEGPRLVNELLSASNVRLVALYATESFAGRYPNREVNIITDAELRRISSQSAPNEVLGIFGKPAFEPPPFEQGFTLMLDGIQDPGNLGSIIRSADWFGVRTIVCSRDCADVFNSKVVQSTMGSITRVQLIYTDLHLFINTTRLPPMYAAVLNGKSLYETGPVQQGALIIGNEAKGISTELLERAGHQITIPKKGGAESLNAGVATGIILSHLLR